MTNSQSPLSHETQVASAGGFSDRHPSELSTSRRARDLRAWGADRGKLSTVGLLGSMVVGVLVLSASMASAQATWQEADVLQRARKADAALRVAESQAKAAQELAEKAGPYPNPKLGVDYEAIPGLYRKTRIMATIPIDFFGARDVEHALAEVDAQAAETVAAVARADAAGWAASRFYAVVADMERVRVLTDALAAAQEAARITQERQKAGLASSYEAIRAVAELELRRSELEAAKVALETDRQDLAAALEPEATQPPAIKGSLDTTQPGGLAQVLAAARQNHPALQTARQTADRAAQVLEQASGFFLPRIDAFGGMNVYTQGERQIGYVFGATVDVALGFDRAASRARASGQTAVAQSRVELLERDLDRRVRRAHAKLLAARAELGRFSAATKDANPASLKSAQAACRKGEINLAQLLDAQKALATIALRQLALAEEAKQAELELRSAMGTL